MAKIIVTGGGGQLGSVFKELSKGSPHSFLFTDVADLDITDVKEVESLFKKEKPDICINCAAYTAVDKAEEEEAKAYGINARGAEHLAIVCFAHDTKLVHVSTDFVFDGKKSSPYTEYDLPSPLSAYGRTKFEGEQKIWQCHDKAIVVRTSWLYSEYGHNFVKTMVRLGREKDKLTVVSDQIGTPTYAWDLARVLLHLCEMALQGKEQVYGTYHYSNEGVASWYDFAMAIFELTGVRVQVDPVGTDGYVLPAKRPSYSVMDKTKIKGVTKMSVPYWRTSLKNCLKKIQAS